MTVTGPLVPEIVADGSVAVMVCVPAVVSVAGTWAMPPVNETAEKLAPPRLSESATESLKPVTTLLYWSSAVMKTLTGENSSTVLLPWLATYRSPFGSTASAYRIGHAVGGGERGAGRGAPRPELAHGVHVLVGFGIVSVISHVQIAVRVQNNGLGAVHAGRVRGAGRGAVRRELLDRAVAGVGHVQVAAGVEGQGVGGGDSGSEVALAVVLPGVNSSTVPLL